MGTGSFPGVNSGRGVTLTPHPLLVPSSWKGTAIPLLPLRAVRPVESLSACTRVHFNFFKLMSTAQALEGKHAHWHSDQPACYVIRYSAPLWKDKENRALSVIYKYKTEAGKASKCLSLPLPLILDYVLLQHTLKSTPRIPKLKNQSNNVSIIGFEHIPAMRLAIKRRKIPKEATLQQWVLIRHQVPTEKLTS